MTMNEGEFICVMGPSGAGKSTFINNLSTIDIPTKGKVYINDTEVRSMGENEIGKFRYENLGFIFQEFNLLDSLTILENIAVPLSLANLPQEEIEQELKKQRHVYLSIHYFISILMNVQEAKTACSHLSCPCNSS